MLTLFLRCDSALIESLHFHLNLFPVYRLEKLLYFQIFSVLPIFLYSKFFLVTFMFILTHLPLNSTARLLGLLSAGMMSPTTNISAPGLVFSLFLSLFRVCVCDQNFLKHYLFYQECVIFFNKNAH